MHSSILIATCLQISVSAAPGPAPTIFNLNRLDFLGMSPAPTPAPERRGLNQLSPRQDSDERTCAYDDGDYNDPVTCSRSYSCFFNTKQSWFGCCTNRACENKKTWCVPSSRATKRFTRSDTLYCDIGTATKCYTWKNIETNRGVTFTTYGCSNIKAINTVYFQAFSTPDSITSTSSPPTPSPPTPNPPTPNPPTPSPPTPSPPAPSPAGAIAGGVVGGVVALAAIAVGIFFLIRHKKKKNAATGTAYHGPPVVAHSQGHMPPSAPMSPQMGQSQPKGQYPPQNPHMGNYAPMGMQPISPPTSPDPTGQAAPAYQPPNSLPQEHKHIQGPSVPQLP